MKLKKVVVLLLCIGIMAFAAACGDDNNGGHNNGGQVKVPDFSIEVVATEGDAGISAANLLIAMLEAEDHTYNMENGNFILGVQFHPEMMHAHYSFALDIFKKLVSFANK